MNEHAFRLAWDCFDKYNAGGVLGLPPGPGGPDIEADGVFAYDERYGPSGCECFPRGCAMSRRLVYHLIEGEHRPLPHHQGDRPGAMGQVGWPMMKPSTATWP